MTIHLLSHVEQGAHVHHCLGPLCSLKKKCFHQGSSPKQHAVSLICGAFDKHLPDAMCPSMYAMMCSYKCWVSIGVCMAHGLSSVVMCMAHGLSSVVMCMAHGLSSVVMCIAHGFV